MMNVVALCLVLSSLATAGVWSPSPGHHKPITGEDVVIVKEGHRVVVVEYDPETRGNTKVLISPQETHVSHHAKEKLSSLADDAKGAKELVEDAEGKVKEVIGERNEKAEEAGSVLPNLGIGISGPNEEHIGWGPREILCDAFGKCKEKIASAMRKAHDKASVATDEMSEKAHEVEEQGKYSLPEAMGRTKDTISQKIDKISSRAEEVKETVTDKTQRIGEGTKEAVDTSKTIGKDVAKNVTSKLDEARQKVERVKEEGEKELGEIFGHGRELMKDVWNYLVSPRLVGSVMGVVHLLGFATAYGMCVWVTFVSSYVLAGALPRQQFGIVQSKVYPVYFTILAYTVMVTLIGHLYGQRKSLFSNTLGMAQAYILLGSFVMVLINLLYLEPRATKVMFERMKMEKEEGRGRSSFVSEPTAKVVDDNVSTTSTPPATATQKPSRGQEKPEATGAAKMAQIMELGERLKKWNAYSSFLNILTLMALTWHVVHLGQQLDASC